MSGFIAVALGGALGAAGRHLVNGMALRLFGPAFPWGTMTANILGSFLMGVVIVAASRHMPLSNNVRLFATTGVLGGFTTFSAFSLDAVAMFERGAMAAAAGYVLSTVVLSIGALFVGLIVARALL